MEILRGIHWEILLVQDLELREAPLVTAQMVRFIEDLSYVLLLTNYMGRFLSHLGKVHWGGYLVQIVDLREAPKLGCQMVELREAPMLK